MVKLSIIILSYNTKDITKQCLTTLLSKLPPSRTIPSEVIVIDNGSTDGSQKMLKSQAAHYASKKQKLILIENEQNVGYPKGNNRGLHVSKGEYILFLNSDVIIKDINFEAILSYLDKHPDVGVLTVKINLSNGRIDPASHRGFPTIWNSFCYFARLERFFARVPLLNSFFGGYHLIGRDLTRVHEIDSPTGAFYLTTKEILKKTGGFDEDYFMYGEDLDLSFRIKKLGYKIVYYPLFTVIHLKYLSGLRKKDLATRKKTRGYFFSAMKIFYRKHYENRYPSVVNKLVYLSIRLLQL